MLRDKGSVERRLSALVLVSLLALAVQIMGDVRRMLRAKARAENTQAQQSIALREQADALIEADQIMGRLLAVTSHEIRGALSATIVAIRTAQLLGERGTADQLRSTLRLAERHTEHVLSVVVDVLSDQRKSGTSTPEPWSDVFEVVQLAVDAAERHKKGHRLRLEVGLGVCDVDPNRLRQVVRNLIENAYRHTPDGCHVLVRATPEPDHLVVTVADDGPGLPAHLRESVLRPYRRGTHPPGTRGSGLGLYVVNELVQAMKGTLDVDSQPGSGTTFTVRLPCTHKPANGVDSKPAGSPVEARR